MLVVKTINNNSVSCKDEDDHEVIVMGRGLGFQCKPGSTVRPELVEKVFHLEGPQQLDRFKDLARRLPVQYLQLCTHIVDYAGTVLDAPLRESVYITLTDHLSFAIQRQNEGSTLATTLNTLEYEVRTFYPRHFAVGLYALSLIQETLGVALPEEEAASIALHLINAEGSATQKEILQGTQLLHDLLDFLSHHPQLSLQPGQPSYDEMAVLLKFLVQRSFSKSFSATSDPLLVCQAEQFSPDTFAIAQQVLARLESVCGCSVPQEEAAYLAIHLRRVWIAP